MRSLLSRFAILLLAGVFVVPSAAIAQTPTNGESLKIVTSPTLKLNYDSKRQESSLVARAVITITAGNKDIPLHKNYGFNINARTLDGVRYANGQTTHKPLTGTIDSGTYYTIPAGKSALFEV